MNHVKPCSFCWLSLPTALLLVTIPCVATRGQGETIADRSTPRFENGAAEVEWIDQHYPETGDLGVRRHALESAIRAFPQEGQTRFRAGVRIAIIDQNEGHPEVGHARLLRLLDAADGIDPDLFAWAEIVDARLLLGLIRVPEATALLQKVAEDRSLSGPRRAMAASDAGNLLMSKSPGAALELLRDAASVKGGDTQDIKAAIAHALLILGRSDDLAMELSGYASSKHENAVIGILDASLVWNLPGDEERIMRLLEVIGDVLPKPSRSLSDAEASCRIRLSSRKIHRRAQELVATNPIAAFLASNVEPCPSTFDGFQRALRVASKDKDVVRCLQLSIQSLAVYGNIGDTPRRVWEAAGYAIWAERVQGRSFDGRICEVMLDLCDQLPIGSEFWIEGKFLRADRRGRKRDRSGEQADLNQVLSVADLSPSYLAPACKRLGRSLEETGDDERALQVYGLCEANAVDYATGVDCLLRAALIDLRLGNDAEAVRLVQLLGNSPAPVVSISESPSQVNELVAFVRTGHAESFWAYNRLWWPSWRSFEKISGLHFDAVAERTPQIPDLVQLIEDARRAASRGDKADFFGRYAVLLSAARWFPSIGPEAAAVSAPAFRLKPDEGESLRSILIEMLAAPHAEDVPNAGKRQLFLASNYLNAHKPGLALKVVADFAARAPRDDMYAPAMHQIRGLAALDENLECAAAAADLESDLASPRRGEERAMAAGVLANLYVRLGRRTDALTLLQREMNDPAIAGDSAGRENLSRELNQLNAPTAQAASELRGGTSGNVASTPGDAVLDNVRGWIRENSLDWYEYVEPQGIDDKTLLNVEELIDDPSKRFPPARQLKFLLLVAQDDRVRPELRQKALASAAVRIVSSATDYSRMSALASSVIEHGAFNDESRLRVLWTVLASLAEEGRKQEYATWRKNPLCEHFTAGIRSRLELLDLEVEVDPKSPESLERLSRLLGSRTLDLTGVQIMSDLLGSLIRIGQIKAADELVASMASWKLDRDAADRIDVLRLEMARRLHRAQVLAPMHVAMRESLLKAFPVVPGNLPQNFRDLRIDGKVPALDRESTFEACLFLASEKQFNREDLSFWQSVFSSMPKTAEATRAIPDLLRKGMIAAQDDDIRSEIIVSFLSAADIDDPEIRESAEHVFSPYREASIYPKSAIVLSLYDIHKALRLGEPIALEKAFDTLNDPRIAAVRARDCLHYYTEISDTEALRRTVGGIRSSTLLSGGFLCTAVPALEKLGLDEELRSARSAARNALRQYLEASWTFYDSGAADAALDLAVVLGDPDVLPKDWMVGAEREIRDPLVSGRVALVAALLNEDWVSLEKSASALIPAAPHHYVLFWYQGLALHHLGRDVEAAEALRVFAGHGKDQLDYPKACELLKLIASKSHHAAAS